MIRRVLAGALLVVILAACSGGGDGPPPTTLPPTTQAPTPVTPTGLVDTVRRWVRHLEAGADDDAFAVLSPQTQAAIGGREGYRTARSELRRVWGRWATTRGATYDGLPVGDGLAVVVVHAPTDDAGHEVADAVPMRAIGDRWYAAPLLDTGPFEVEPADESTVEPEPELGVRVAEDVTVTAFVDGQPADVTRADAGVTYRPSVGLRPGWHLAVLVFERDDAVTARTVRYQVPAPT